MSTMHIHHAGGQTGDWRDLAPLFSIFGVIAALTFGTMVYFNEWGFMPTMMYSMAYFFIVFGAFKLTNLPAFAEAYRAYDLLAERSVVYAYAYPFIEIVLGMLYFFSLGGLWRDGVTAILMTIGALGVWRSLNRKDGVRCACLGTVFHVPMTYVTLVENVLMAAMAASMFILPFLYPTSHGMH